MWSRDSGMLVLACMEIGKCCNSGLSSRLESPLTSPSLAVMQSQIRSLLKPQSVWKLGWLFRVVESVVRELGTYTPALSVTGCGLPLGGGKTLARLSSAEVITKEGWPLEALCRHHPSPWGSKFFKRSLPQVPYGLPIYSSLSTNGSAGLGASGRAKLVSSLWLGFGFIAWKLQQVKEALAKTDGFPVFPPSLELNV